MTISDQEFQQKTKEPYGEVRPKIENGDLLLCSGMSFISEAIKTVTKSHLSHVAFIVIADDIKRLMIMESVESQGVRTVPLSHYLNNYRSPGVAYNGRLYVARHKVLNAKVNDNSDLLVDLATQAVDRFGYAYDRDDIFRIAARISSRLFGLPPGADLSTDHEYICSEFVDVIFQSLDVAIARTRDDFIAPADFALDPNVTLVGRIL